MVAVDSPVWGADYSLMNESGVGVTGHNDVLSRIEQALDDLRPYIASHNGRVEVVDFDDEEGTLLLRMGGTCHGCSASTVTLRQGIEARLRQTVPEVRQVEAL